MQTTQVAKCYCTQKPLYRHHQIILPVVVLLFPDGRLPSPRWRPALWSYAALCAVFVVAAWGRAAADIAKHSIHPRHQRRSHDHGAQRRVGQPLGPPGLCPAHAARAELRRPADAELAAIIRGKRQQLKWLVGVAVLSVVSVLVSAAIGSAPGIRQVASDVLGFGLVATPAPPVQHAVDRRFNRARYNADETVAAFAIRLKDAVDLNSVQADPDTNRNRAAWESASEKPVREYQDLLRLARDQSSLAPCELDILRPLLRSSPAGTWWLRYRRSRRSRFVVSALTW